MSNELALIVRFLFLTLFFLPLASHADTGRKIDSIQVEYLGFHTGMTQEEFSEKAKGKFLVLKQSTLQKEGTSFLMKQTLKCKNKTSQSVLQVNFRSLDRYNRRRVWGEYEISKIMGFEEWKNILNRIPSSGLLSEAVLLQGDVSFGAFLNSPDASGELVHYVYQKTIPHAGADQIRETFIEKNGEGDCSTPLGIYYFQVKGRYDIRVSFSDEKLVIGISDSKLVSELLNRWFQKGKENAEDGINSLSTTPAAAE